MATGAVADATSLGADGVFGKRGARPGNFGVTNRRLARGARLVLLPLVAVFGSAPTNPERRDMNLSRRNHDGGEE